MPNLWFVLIWNDMVMYKPQIFQTWHNFSGNLSLIQTHDHLQKLSWFNFAENPQFWQNENYCLANIKLLIFHSTQRPCKHKGQCTLQHSIQALVRRECPGFRECQHFWGTVHVLLWVMFYKKKHVQVMCTQYSCMQLFFGTRHLYIY